MAQGLPVEMLPGKEYVGIVCVACDRSVAIAGPLEAPPDKPVTIGARKPLDVECPFCHHKASYTVDKLQRMRAPAAS
jgi:hypothetical protein